MIKKDLSTYIFSWMLQNFVFKMIKKMQSSEDEKNEDNSQSKAISLSLIIIAIRSIIFVLGYRLRQLHYTPSMPIAVSSCAVYIALEIGYWIKASREDLSRVRKIQTIILHLWSFVCFLGVGLTVNYNDVKQALNRLSLRLTTFSSSVL